MIKEISQYGCDHEYLYAVDDTGQRFKIKKQLPAQDDVREAVEHLRGEMEKGFYAPDKTQLETLIRAAAQQPEVVTVTREQLEKIIAEVGQFHGAFDAKRIGKEAADNIVAQYNGVKVEG